ncbi:hypothetical protein AN944_04062 [Shewanella sp. P1-14-1]|uniref:hypothetical protein n=1 Tax=Shewanella sp. P1-14-1 TaxID=1723761 RepID=UPI0006D67F6A|nr:hypothetical protein [Shewanella sp. P1-14-1]KPZ67461.1 hypothetical protein AN944_04062 [Shewanella sp. P1-14-1]
MKLIGSKAEREFREELINSNVSLNTDGKRLNYILKNAGYDVSNSYVLNYIPEQCEDIYVLLISGSYVLHVEVDKFDSQVEPAFERVELNDYLHSLSKKHQIQMAVAMDLVKT